MGLMVVHRFTSDYADTDVTKLRSRGYSKSCRVVISRQNPGRGNLSKPLSQPSWKSWTVE